MVVTRQLTTNRPVVTAVKMCNPNGYNTEFVQAETFKNDTKRSFVSQLPEFGDATFAVDIVEVLE